MLFQLSCTRPFPLLFFFFFNDTATTEIYTLSLHDALPICGPHADGVDEEVEAGPELAYPIGGALADERDRYHHGRDEDRVDRDCQQLQGGHESHGRVAGLSAARHTPRNCRHDTQRELTGAPPRTSILSTVGQQSRPLR